MRNVLEDFEINSYQINKDTYLNNNMYNKSLGNNSIFNEKNKDYLLNVYIEELDKIDSILFTEQQIKSMYCDIKNGIFVFKGIINEKDTENLKLIKNTLKNKTFNQLLKI